MALAAEAPSQDGDGEDGERGDAEQVVAEAEHLAPAQQPHHLRQLGDPEQLRGADVDQAAEREPAAERDDLAEEAAPERPGRGRPRSRS